MRLAFSMLAGLSLSACADDAPFVQHVQLDPQYTVTRQGCQVWDPFPKSGELADWAGPCVGGFADGQGRETWKVPNPQPHLADPVMSTSSVYNGTMRHGLREGDGTVSFFSISTGDRRSVLTGHWHDDLLEGTGSVVNTPGGTYAGGFHLGRLEGHGIGNFPDGSIYDGTFHDGFATGHGRITKPNGFRYEGDMLSGNADGHGVATYADGTRYEGDFHFGVPDGQGRLIPPGARPGGPAQALEGQWHRGCLTGSEPFVCVDLYLHS